MPGGAGEVNKHSRGIRKKIRFLLQAQSQMPSVLKQLFIPSHLYSEALQAEVHQDVIFTLLLRGDKIYSIEEYA